MEKSDLFGRAANALTITWIINFALLAMRLEKPQKLHAEIIGWWIIMEFAGNIFQSPCRYTTNGAIKRGFFRWINEHFNLLQNRLQWQIKHYYWAEKYLLINALRLQCLNHVTERHKHRPYPRDYYYCCHYQAQIYNINQTNKYFWFSSTEKTALNGIYLRSLVRLL